MYSDLRISIRHVLNLGCLREIDLSIRTSWTFVGGTMKSDEREVEIEVGEVKLRGNLAVPQGSRSMVLFAHGSGSGRLSPRNQYVAKALRRGGLATLLMDLLTEEEEAADEFTRQWRFDIELLARRLIGATAWMKTESSTKALSLGYFGASTGAAAALVAAARQTDEVKAIVSRGGRPDLAGNALSAVQAPTLLIVGGADYGVIALNQEAMEKLAGKKKLEIIPGATHLFEEPGALEAVARLALTWFVENLGGENGSEAKR